MNKIKVFLSVQSQHRLTAQQAKYTVLWHSEERSGTNKHNNHPDNHKIFILVVMIREDFEGCECLVLKHLSFDFVLDAP